jgi:hypothetical protein
VERAKQLKIVVGCGRRWHFILRHKFCVTKKPVEREYLGSAKALNALQLARVPGE